jgi:hypothetical protein
MLTLVLFIVLVALIFDFINGFHDAANSSLGADRRRDIALPPPARLT